ncbi:MAG: glycoside hydrolase family 88 protein [Clostridia bacterium]|nr:glycoside hydrolase family 88 protein [Clostridia bacterium]
MLLEKDREFIDNTWKKLDEKLEKVAVKSRNKIPHRSVNGVHDDRSSVNRITGWTNGFWGGLMWLMFVGTNNPEYKITAQKSSELLDQAFSQSMQLHHDVGFMWHLTSGAEYAITGDEKAKNRNFLASMILASRYEPKGEFIRAWNGTWQNQDTEGWTIIDCMMNLSLLYWASEISKDKRFYRIAEKHADMAMRDHVRENGSVNHIVVHDSEKPNSVICTKAGQGYAVGSSWSRGCSWAVYGFTISYIHTKKKEYLDTAIKCADYFLSQIEKTDYLPLCDFNQPENPQCWDSSAGAISACGLIELAKILGEEKGEKYLNGGLNIIKTLTEKCADFTDNDDCVIQLNKASYNGTSDQQTVIYADFFYAEALLKLKGSNFFIW